MCDLFGNCGKRLRGCGPCLVETWWASAVSSVACAVALYLRLSFLCSDATVCGFGTLGRVPQCLAKFICALPGDGGAEYQPWGEGLAPRLALQKDGQRFVTSSRSSVQFGTLGFFFASGRSHACWLWEWVWKKTAYPRLVAFLMQCTSHGFWLSFIVITWCSQKYYKNCSVRPLHFAASVVILSFLLFSIFVWLSLFLSAFSFVKWLLYWLVHCIHSLYLIISSDVAA